MSSSCRHENRPVAITIDIQIEGLLQSPLNQDHHIQLRNLISFVDSSVNPRKSSSSFDDPDRWTNDSFSREFS